MELALIGLFIDLHPYVDVAYGQVYLTLSHG